MTVDVDPKHHNYQCRLKKYLEGSKAKGIELETDYVDVRFRWRGHLFLGEIKPTNGSPDVRRPFREALGQVLDYRWVDEKDKTADMIIFLDQRLDSGRIALASRLGVSVIAETSDGQYELLNRPKPVGSALTSLFPRAVGSRP